MSGESIAELYESGLTMREVGERVGISSSSVLRSLKKMGVKSRRQGHAKVLVHMRRESGFKVADGPSLIARYESGEPMESIARSLRVCPRTLRRFLRVHGVTIRGRGRPPKRPTVVRKRLPARPTQAHRTYHWYDGKLVEATPPMASEELMELHNLSATERMLVYRMVDRIKRGKPVEEVLYDAGVKGARRQYHLMTTAIAAAKEAGVMFNRRRESA